MVCTKYDVTYLDPKKSFLPVMLAIHESSEELLLFSKGTLPAKDLAELRLGFLSHGYRFSTNGLIFLCPLGILGLQKML